MSLIKFLISRKQEKSVLASKKYGKVEVSTQENDKSILAKRKYGQNFKEKSKEF